MCGTAIEFWDGQEINPAFYHELKAVVKKEPLFEDIYNEAVKEFCLKVFDKGLRVASETDSFTVIYK
jgi:hypothetical protein